MATKFNFYNYAKILSFNAFWNFIVGPRGNGKTYGAKLRAIKDAIHKGRQFVYVRRYKEELALARDAFFADIEANNEFPDWDFRINGRMAQMAPRDTRDAEKRKWTDIGFFVALSTAQSYKSVSFPNVYTIIFDEFILEKSSQIYLKNEAAIFKNLYSTIDRNQDRTRVYFLANAVSIMNPYFLDLKISPDGTDQIGRMNRLADGRYYVAYHFIQDEVYIEQVSQSMFGQFIAGSAYDDFANKSEFADNHQNLVEGKPQDAKYVMTIETKDGIFAVWVAHNPRRYYVTITRPGIEYIVTTELDRVADDKPFLAHSDGRNQMLRRYYNNGMVKFQNAESRNLFARLYQR